MQYTTLGRMRSKLFNNFQMLFYKIWQVDGILQAKAKKRFFIFSNIHTFAAQ